MDAREELLRCDPRLAEGLAEKGIEFDEWIGSGAHAHVARARHRGISCALKLGPPDAMQREFEASRGLSHPSLLTPYAFVGGQRSAALVMPFFAGVSIVDAIRASLPSAASDPARRKNLPMAFGYEMSDLGVSNYAHCGAAGEDRLRRWIPRVGGALSAMHRTGRVHMDVAPGNILASGDEVVLLDFGLTHRVDARDRDLPIGSAAYLAPELGLGRPSPAADWYSLGVVLFQALTGGLPFEGGGPEVLIRKQSMIAPRPNELCPAIADDLDTLCAELLERDPKKRRHGVHTPKL